MHREGRQRKTDGHRSRASTSSQIAAHLCILPCNSPALVCLREAETPSIPLALALGQLLFPSVSAINLGRHIHFQAFAWLLGHPSKAVTVLAYEHHCIESSSSPKMEPPSRLGPRIQG